MVGEVPRCLTVKTAVHHDTHLVSDPLSVFELHGSQSMPGPLTCYDGPHTVRKIQGTEGADGGPLTFAHHQTIRIPVLKTKVQTIQLFL